jgi:CDGSH-type Zn-finger protein
MASAPEALITPYRDGPLLVRGRVRIVDAQGHELEHRREPIALCRCGKSRLRPFCDGTHKLIGFRAPGAPESACGSRISDLEHVELEISKQGTLTVRPARHKM